MPKFVEICLTVYRNLHGQIHEFDSYMYIYMYSMYTLLEQGKDNQAKRSTFSPNNFVVKAWNFLKYLKAFVSCVKTVILNNKFFNRWIYKNFKPLTLNWIWSWVLINIVSSIRNCSDIVAWVKLAEWKYHSGWVKKNNN